jgi:hypothetical protein
VFAEPDLGLCSTHAMNGVVCCLILASGSEPSGQNRIAWKLHHRPAPISHSDRHRWSPLAIALRQTLPTAVSQYRQLNA